jgi:hypothetical protein
MKMRKFLFFLALALLAGPAAALAADEAVTVEDLRKKIDELNKQLAEISDRVDKTEKKTATDRISFTGDLRAKADTLHYNDVAINRGSLVTFGGSPPFPFAMGQTVKYDFNNDILYTTRLRLNMKAKVANNVNFAGRLTMYKNWGDSTGVQVFDSFDSVAMDGDTVGQPGGDTLHVERAYFDWHDIGGTPFYLSIGRRPSTYGPPSQFRENELRGGTPSGHLVHFQFDGITAGYNLSKHTDVEGQVVRFCYGQGFESDFGNGTLAQPSSDLDDVHLGGFNVDLINDGTHFLQATLFRAQDVTDGFKGLAVLPALVDPSAGLPTAAIPVVTRLSATENLGDITLGGLGYVHESDNGVNWFVSGAWNRTHPTDKVSQFGFGGLLYDSIGVLADTNGDGMPDTITGFIPDRAGKENRDGFSIYTGVQIPAPLGKLGLEYNWGSRYWFNFTQAQDDLVGSKLAARGHVGEAYYIFEVNPNMFIKVGGIYYDYKYTGSGSPVGEPKKVADVQDGKAFSPFPVIDTAWDGYASLTVKF